MRSHAGIAILLLLPVLVLSQTLAHRSYSTGEGLLQTQVDCIYPDGKGYVWIGTRGGLSCYNGGMISNYHELSDPAGLSIQSIAADTAGLIYYGTQQGIFRFDGTGIERLVRLDVRYTDLYIDRGNRMWVYWQKSGRGNNGVDLYHLLENGLAREEIRDPELKELIDRAGFIHLLEEDGKAMLIGRMSHENWGWYSTATATRLQLDFHGVAAKYIHHRCGDTGTDWEGKLYNDPSVAEEMRRIKLVERFPESPEGPPSASFAWLIKENREMVRLDCRSGEIRRYSTGLEEIFSRYTPGSEGCFWLGGEDGFSQLFPPYVLEYDREEFNMAWSTPGTGGDSLLFASWQSGVFLRSGGGSKRLNIPCLQGKNEFYMGAETSADGRIFLPHTRGVVILDRSLRCDTSLSRPKTDPYNRTIQDVAIDEEKGLLLGAADGGVAVFDIAAPRAHYLYTLLFPREHLRSIYANTVFIDGDGSWWIGHQKGLSHYNPTDSTWTHWSERAGNFPAANVAGIYRDRRGNYWFGTGRGLVFMDRSANARLVESDLLYGVVNVVDSFDRDRIILGGSFGLAVIDLKAWYGQGRLRGKVFNGSNGFMAGEPVENGIYRLDDGSLMVATQSYPVRLFPERMPLSAQPLSVRIRSVNDSLIPFHAQPQFKMEYNIDEVRIGFEAFGLYRPEQETRYSYKLDDDDWSDWQVERFVELSGLGSGNHRIQLRARTPGVDPALQPVTSLQLLTSVPIWREPAFPEIVTASFGGAILLLAVLGWVNYRQRRKNQRYALEIDYLRIQSLQAQMNPHFVFNILGTLQNMILQSDLRQANRQLVNLSTLIRRFLDSTVRGDLPEGSTEIREHSLENEIELLRLYIDFEQLQYRDLFDYRLDIDPDIDLANTGIPPMLIQPFVENAIKHGLMLREEKGLLIVSIRRNDGDLCISIEDDGVGRELAREVRAENLDSHQSYGSGLVRQRIDLLNKFDYGIEFGINDRPGGGTIVTMKISE